MNCQSKAVESMELGACVYPKHYVQAMFGNAGVRPGRRSTFLSGKVDKTNDAPSGPIRWEGHKMESGPTRCAQTGPAKYKERPTLGPGGRRRIVGRGKSLRHSHNTSFPLELATGLDLATGPIFLKVRQSKFPDYVRNLTPDRGNKFEMDFFNLKKLCPVCFEMGWLIVLMEKKNKNLLFFALHVGAPGIRFPTSLMK